MSSEILVVYYGIYPQDTIAHVEKGARERVHDGERRERRVGSTLVPASIPISR